MQTIERAIRNALTKTDAKTSEGRQRVYTSAWQVHERALMQNRQIDEVQRNQRRQQLTQLIRGIEAEFVNMPNAALNSENIRPSQSEQDEQSESFGSLGGVNPTRDYGVEDRSSDLDTEIRKTDKNSVKNKKTSSFFKPLILILIFIIFILGIVFFYFGQIANAPSSSDGRVNSTLNTGPFKEGENSDALNWITIFTPKNAERISLQASATANIINIDGVDYLRIQSKAPNDVIRFDIGEGILRQFINKKATFNIVARSSDGKPAQMAITCNFGSMGDCQRRRYDITGTTSDFLFDVQLSTDKVVPQNGIISINTDLTGSGRAIDILAIRVEKPE